MLWKRFVGSLILHNENDLTYFQLKYVVGRGLCIACNTLRMLVLINECKDIVQSKWNSFLKPCFIGKFAS
jgi:hypothetical protein